MLIEKIKSLKLHGTYIVLAVVLLLGIAIAVLGDYRSGKDLETVNNDLSIYYYTESIEKRLERLLYDINGITKASVMVTIESSFENVYASNAMLEESSTDLKGSESKNTKKEIAFADGKNGGREPVLLKSVCPKIKGVMVVLEGRADVGVVSIVKNAISSLLGIGETKVSVIYGGDRKLEVANSNVKQ